MGRGYSLLRSFIDRIAALPDRSSFSRADLLLPEFELQREGNLAIFYAPLEHVNRRAKLILVGITPGFTQMEISYRVARRGLLDGLPEDVLAPEVKRQALFGGPMRATLLNMLDGIGLPEALGIGASSALFGERADLLHATNTVCYPVFTDAGANYRGHSPTILGSPLLRAYVDDQLLEELAAIPNALVAPLGVSVSQVLRSLIGDGLLDAERCLFGLPHPSGSNGHRLRQYAAAQSDLRQKVRACFGSRTPRQVQHPAAAL